MHNRTPTRQDSDITQQYNSGVITICMVENISSPGELPVEKLRPKYKLRFDERRLGLQRFYRGMAEQVKIERVIRCPFREDISSQDIAVASDGRQYAVHMIQLVQDIWPKSMDITLAATEQKFEVKHDPAGI